MNWGTKAMPNNRHRRVARLRTPEERERIVYSQFGMTTPEVRNTMSKAIRDYFKRVARRVKKDK